MGITQQFIALLGASEKEMESIIDKMSEQTAKQMLKVLIKEIKGQKNAEGKKWVP